jgi:ADP-ribosylglycohydrolase
VDTKEIVNRYLGCLFGLAAGDALGAPVEFLSREDILAQYGPQGITEYKAWGSFPAGSFTDDTQMSLATAEGCIRAYQHLRARGTVHPAGLVWKRYKEWLRSQNKPEQRRAPGSTCLAALKSAKMPTTDLKANDSKGCGGVMRTAPIGLAYAPPEAFHHGLECGALTHGHPTGYLTSGFIAAMVAHLVGGTEVAEAVQRTMPLLEAYKGHEDTKRKLGQALALTSSGTLVPQAIEALGGGWVADEALAIAVYCALKHPGDFRAGVTAAVNHSGDSDSTGCITGAIMGTALGVDEIPPPWLNGIEDYDAIKKLSVDLFRVARTGAELSQEEYPPD